MNRWIGDQQHDGEQAQPAASSEETLPELGDGKEYLDLGHFKTVDNIQETWDIDNQAEEDGPAKKDAGDNIDATDKDLSEHSGAAAEESPEESRQEESKPEKKWSKDELLKESRRFNIDLTPRLLYARYYFLYFYILLTRDEDPIFFSTDPDPAQPEKYSGSDLKSK